ncbi:MAG: TolC family protein, partial [Planctomycetia bacterium]
MPDDSTTSLGEPTPLDRTRDGMASALESLANGAGLEPADPISAKSSGWGSALLAAVTLVVGGLWWTGKFDGLLTPGAPSPTFQTHRVARGPLKVNIVEDGNVESAANVDLKCLVEGGSTILWIIEQGKQVKAGTELVRLDSSTIETNINTQKIAAERARSTLIQAEEDTAVAKIGVREYNEGTFKQLLQTAEAAIVVARQNLRSSQNVLDYSEKMFRKGFINELQLDTNKDTVERAKLDLETADTAKTVLIEFTKPKMVRELESLRDAAAARAAAEKAAFDLEALKLARLEDQLKKCTIVAPQAGMVVYANESSRFSGRSEANIQEGAIVREYQNILRLPDLTQMQVKALVH